MDPFIWEVRVEDGWHEDYLILLIDFGVDVYGYYTILDFPFPHIIDNNTLYLSDWTGTFWWGRFTRN